MDQEKEITTTEMVEEPKTEQPQNTVVLTKEELATLIGDAYKQALNEFYNAKPKEEPKEIKEEPKVLTEKDLMSW